MLLRSLALPVAACLLVAATLTGCNSAPVAATPARLSESTLQAKVYGGQQPVTASTIQLYAVNTTTDGGPSTPLLKVTITTSDGTGLANANANANNSFNTLPKGYFNINASDYTCPTASTLVYLTASQGNPGLSAGSNNPDIQELAAIGACSLIASTSTVTLNEVTTAGAIIALAPYATAYNSIGATAAHASALSSAFNLANEYVNFQTGRAPGPALPSGFAASTPDLYTLANILAYCVNSAGGTYNDGSPCGTLFYYTKPSGASANPADTFTALLNIHNNPTLNVAALFNLQTGNAPFQPTPAMPPADFSTPITQMLAAVPAFSLPTGTYNAVQSVTISESDTNATVYYTTDGSTPGAFSAVYSSPISIQQTTTLNAIAIDGSARSAVTSATYTLSGLTSPVALSSATATAGSTTPATVMASSTANGSVVTFGLANGANGSFTPTTCTIAGGSCSVSYVPSGTLGSGTRSGGITASFAATSSYVAASASSNLTITAAPTFSLSVITALTGGTGAAIGSQAENTTLVQASDGNFYGTTYGGGMIGQYIAYGTVFKVTPSGTFTSLHTFSGSTSDGSSPYAGLVQGTDGNFYGVTQYGGSSNFGTIFSITPTGTFTLLHSFTGSTTDGKNSQSGLIQGTDGNFYGTTGAGGLTNYGTVFKITPSGTFSLVYSFSSATTDGSFPAGTLVQAADGNFYGTTYSGGANNYGTLFKLTPAGAFTLLHSFTANIDGRGSYSALVQGTDGNLYGTTVLGGSGSYGTAFKTTTSGTFTLLHSFTTASTDGQQPESGLVQGTDGSFYGMTGSGGASTTNGTPGGAGTIYRITPSGTFSLLHSFSAAANDGEKPYGALVQGADGNFFGITNNDGGAGKGVIFKFAASPALAAPVTLTVPSSVTRSSAFTLGYAVSNATSVTMQQCFATNTAGDTTGWTGIKTALPTVTNLSLKAPAAAGTYTYTLTCGGVESSSTTLTVQ